MDTRHSEPSTSSTGGAGAVIRITRFEQNIKMVTSVVGSSASDYDSAARTQFKMGVANALGIERYMYLL